LTEGGGTEVGGTVVGCVDADVVGDVGDVEGSPEDVLQAAATIRKAATASRRRTRAIGRSCLMRVGAV
jgi:hypothetical protein